MRMCILGLCVGGALLLEHNAFAQCWGAAVDSESCGRMGRGCGCISQVSMLPWHTPQSRFSQSVLLFIIFLFVLCSMQEKGWGGSVCGVFGVCRCGLGCKGFSSVFFFVVFFSCLIFNKQCLCYILNAKCYMNQMYYYQSINQSIINGISWRFLFIYLFYRDMILISIYHLNVIFFKIKHLSWHINCLWILYSCLLFTERI